MSPATASATRLLREAARQFTAHYGRPATTFGIAPGRVNLIGDHTDYTGGLAMPFAIDRYVAVVGATVADSASVRVRSSAAPRGSTVDLQQRPIARAGDWSDYVRGVLNGLRNAGFDVPAMEILVHSSLPTGAGLSSSAALEVAAIRLALMLAGAEAPATQVIDIAHTAEHDYARVPCGQLDQCSVTVAQRDHLLLYDSRAGGADAVPFDSDALAFVVIDSQIRHAHASSGYADRRRQCETLQLRLGKSLRDASADSIEAATDDPVLIARGRHVVGENRRVRDMQSALATGDLKRAGSLMFESHASMRDDFAASCAETDLLVALASRMTDRGLVGARQTGGGFGGSVIALMHAGEAATLARELADRYAEATGLVTAPLIVHPVDGATAGRLQELR